MARDPSYAEYVDARWFVLYRLAALLVGEEHAGAVTEAALLQAYLDWPAVREVASPDEHVQGLLARIAVEQVGDGERPRPVDRALDALPPEQRAVIVLRCFELLDETAIARALGREVADVEADWVAGLAAVRRSEQQLAEELEREAEAMEVPPPPVEVLVARGHDQQRGRRRRRLAWAGLVALALVVALAEAALVQGLSGRDGRAELPPFPASLSRLPVGEPARVAYAEGLSVQLPGGPLIVPRAPTALLQAGPWVYLAYPSGEVDRIDGRSLAVVTVTEQSAGAVVADPAGRYVAWVEARPGARRPVVVVRRIGPRGETLEQQERAFPEGVDPFVLVALDRNGDVFGTRPAERDAIWVWHTGQTPASSRGVFDRIFGAGNGILTQVISGHLVVDTAGAFAVGAPRGTNLVYDQEVSGMIVDFADPSGRRIVQVDETGNGTELFGVWVMERTGGRDPARRRTRLRLPIHAAIADVRWEDAGHVLVDIADTTAPNGALVRCDVHTATCELAATFDGPHLLAH